MTRIFLSETRERFLRAIAAEIPPERLIEGFFFQAVRQGGIESGVAVIAARPERPPEPVVVADAPPAVPDEADDDALVEAALAAEAALEAAYHGDGSAGLPDTYEVDDEDGAASRPAPRSTVYSASYRLVLKGPERGTWECSVVAEADAPLVTVDAVVRGVQRRSGDLEPPERMSGNEMVDALITLARK